MKMNKFGEIAFLAGVLIAILVGLFQMSVATGTLAIVLVLLGIIVGFLNISEKETTGYLVAAIALLAASGASGFASLPMIGLYLAAMLGNIALFVAPAAVIVALKTVITLAKKK
jgi:uncharacterized membrane protein